MREISISDLRSIHQIVKEKFNYDFSNYASSSYKRRIARLMEMKKVVNVIDFTNKINKGDISKEDFLCEVTVNVTEMFRDPSFWKYFRTLISAYPKTNEKIKIWHARCSSGEEVYSMLILLKEMNLLDMVEITATDIDHKILAKAKSGVLAGKNMELNNSNYVKSGGNSSLSNYFKCENDLYKLDAKLVSKVSFAELDLVDFASTKVYDFILCRNVMIYFNQTLQNSVITKMHKSLATAGFLILGCKESLAVSDISNKFVSVNYDNKVYKKTKD